MTNRRGRPQVVTIDETNNQRATINFNYSENFNKVVELTT